MKEPPELIPVRDGEDLDERALSLYLGDKLSGAKSRLEVSQFGGGHANLTYLIRCGGREYVLRRPPIGTKAASSHDMGREYRVLSALHEAFPPAPKALLHCEDLSVIGAPFFVMERRSGTVVRGVIPEAYGGGKDPGKNRALSEVLIDTLVAFHGADYRGVGLEGIGKPEGFMARQVVGWAERYEKAKTKEIEWVGDLTGWLREKLPISPVPTLLHNDWRLDNIMLDRTDPKRVVAVFDWDMCTLGDPLADLGTLLSLWIEAGEGLENMAIMPSHVPGFMTRQEAIERYGERSGRDVSRIVYYRVFGMFKMAVIAQQIYYRFKRGETTDSRFEPFGMAAEFLIAWAWSEAQSSKL